MYLMVDNYDSFVYNLACYLEECGERVELVRNDKISAKEIEGMLKTGAFGRGGNFSRSQKSKGLWKL